MGKRVDKAFWVLLATSVFLFTGVSLSLLLEEEPFQPVDYTVPQQIVYYEDGRAVVPRIGSFDEPAVRAGDVVPVESSVCVNHDEPVRVIGDVYWERLSPKGLRVQAGEGAGHLDPGCVTRHFENDMPQAVIDDVVRSGTAELWQISGVIVVDEPNGGTTSWNTERFWVVP